MTLEDLRIFVAACRAGSLSGLARELGRTQSAVSQHIARLENELGVPLLKRLARGVEPTEAGRVLCELAAEGLESIDFAVRRIAALKQDQARTLTITTGGTTVRHFFRDAVVRFRREHPAVNIRFLPANSTRRCFEILRRGEADLAFVTTGEAARGTQERAVVRQSFFLLAAAGDPIAQREELRVADLAGIRYLGLAEGTTHREALEEAVATLGVTLRPQLTFDDFDTACIFVELGLGHAIVPAVQAHNFQQTAAVQAVPIVDLPPVAVGWAFRHEAHLSAPARAFLDLFDGELEKVGQLPGVEVVSRAHGQRGAAVSGTAAPAPTGDD